VSSAPPSSPRILSRGEHSVSRKKITENALKVLYRLHRQGYKAYVVGGGVRDLMLGGQPKDFDVSTNARPNEIRRLFRNSRIIGRRFRLVHVFFHGEVIEVSTFRRDPDPEHQRGGPDDPLITNDNVWGSPRQDAFRRDFTVNGLFYDIADYSVIDYVGGIEDLDKKLIRTIGDPVERFKEDPVRMVRACEFAARLGFGIEAATQHGILAQARGIERASPARLTEELIQLMRCGSAGGVLQRMLDLELLDVMLPEAHAMIDPASSSGGLSGVLPALDRMVASGEKLSDVTLLATPLLASFDALVRQREAQHGGRLNRGQVIKLAAAVVDPMAQRFTLSRVRAEGTRQALAVLYLLEGPAPSPAARVQITNRLAFPDSLALLELKDRALGRSGEVLAGWRQAAKHRKKPEPAAKRPRRRRSTRRRRRRRRPAKRQ
jgi:poly(A) polymerase